MLKNLIILGILTVITVSAWIGFDVYHNFTTSTISKDTAKTVIPITPTFDQEAISLVQKRQQLPVDLAGGPQAATESARRSTPTPSATSSAQVRPTTTIVSPTATPTVVR